MGGRGTIIIYKHTRVGTGFHSTVLVTAHCPALGTGNVRVRLYVCLSYDVHMSHDCHMAIMYGAHACVCVWVRE